MNADGKRELMLFFVGSNGQFSIFNHYKPRIQFSIVNCYRPLDQLQERKKKIEQSNNNKKIERVCNTLELASLKSNNF